MVISLYIHVPFCTKKCPYCHFFVVPNRSSYHQPFVQGLKKEFSLIAAQLENKKIVSLYFGGGTPSLLGADVIAEILSWIKLEPGAEVTLEANPNDVTLSGMQAFQRAGINRVSLGVQSLSNSLLYILGREHTAAQGIEAVQNTAASGISNISIDLMYELPKQTLSLWQKSLDALTKLPITHLSLYNLTFEPGALFFKKQKTLLPLLPSPETSLRMLQLACSTLQSLGFERYEISAFAKPGFQSQHNKGYWTSRPFLGLGPSAFSFWEGRRFRNICHLTKYLDLLNKDKRPIDFEEKLLPLASLHERFAVRLRLFEEISLEEFPIDPFLLKKLEKQGWVTLSSRTVRLTEQGRLFYDSVAEEVILL